MTVQVVRPAGAGYETLLVLALCAVIVALAGTVVYVRTAPGAVPSMQTDEFDARRDLSSAEQGLYADLRVAADEILFMIAAPGGDAADDILSVEALAGEGLPPFVRDASAARSGAHSWQRIQWQSGSAYLGLSADVAVAGSLLLRLPRQDTGDSLTAAGHDHGVPDAHKPGRHGVDAGPDIWLSRRAGAQAPDSLDDIRLLAAGWRKIAAQFDAGVTRQQR